jgi:hypothetical protein
MYRCSLLVLDEPGSRRAWSAPDIVLGPGEKGEKSSTHGPMQVNFKASISKSVDHADTAVTVTRDGKIVLRQVSSFSLDKTPSANRPLE